MESMFPALIAKHRRGGPKVRHGSALRQSGWHSMPTRKPALSSTRARIAMAKLGWSTYASPETKTMSTSSQPRAAISARLIGSGSASGTAGRRDTRGWWTRVGFMVLPIDVREECSCRTSWSPVYRLLYQPLAIKGREWSQSIVLHWECCSPPGMVLADAKQLPGVFSLSCNRLERCAPLATRSSACHMCLVAQEDEVFLLGLAAAPVLA